MNEQPRSLHDLATTAVTRHQGASGRELARKASDAGFTIASTTINHVLAGTYRSRPGPKTLDALAWLAGVSRQLAYDAAGEHLSHSPFADELPPEVDRLSPKQRQAVVTVIRAMLDPGVQATGADTVPRATRTADDAVDEVEQARRNRGPRPPEIPAAARTADSEDIAEHTRSLQRGEENQDPGGLDPA